MTQDAAATFTDGGSDDGSGCGNGNNGSGGGCGWWQ